MHKCKIFGLRLRQYIYVTSIGDYAFLNCKNLTSVLIPSSVVSIGELAFGACSNLTGIEIPSSVTTIGSSAFAYCVNLTSVEIPASVTSMGTIVFGYCTNLISISVDGENTTYLSENGVLFNKDKTILMAYPVGKADTAYVMPSGVTSIEDYAFVGCVNLESIEISSSLISIGSSAFRECTKLTSVTFADPSGWYVASSSSDTSGTDVSSDIVDASTAATYLKSTYVDRYWKKKTL